MLSGGVVEVISDVRVSSLPALENVPWCYGAGLLDKY
ncbi:unnamed protein product, partial [Wuchereria bancrofti]